MAPNPTANRIELFTRYEAALVGLVKVPTRLDEELAKAKAAYETAQSKAAATTKDEEQRLARLRQTVLSRFAESAESLRAANVLIPHQIRAATGQEGDPNSLTAAIDAQNEAEKAVARELRDAANAAKLQAAGDRSRAAAGQEAAEALRRRQEQVRQARQEAAAEAERKRIADAQRLKQQRQLMIFGSAAALVVLVILAALLL